MKTKQNILENLKKFSLSCLWPVEPEGRGWADHTDWEAGRTAGRRESETGAGSSRVNATRSFGRLVKCTRMGQISDTAVTQKPEFAFGSNQIQCLIKQSKQTNNQIKPHSEECSGIYSLQRCHQCPGQNKKSLHRGRTGTIGREGATPASIKPIRSFSPTVGFPVTFH